MDVPGRSAPAVLWRRLRWRLHWALRPDREFMVDPWWEGMRLALPRSGSAATAFYRTFPSESIAVWMGTVLERDMTVIDVGAHAGIYSLICARLVGPNGTVYAVEPQPDLAAVIERNASLNGLLQVKVRSVAFLAESGTVGLVADRRTGGALTVPGEQAAPAVSASTLDDFASEERIESVGLVKLDAAGNELAVLRGGRDLLAGGAIKSLICKLYAPAVTAARFGVRAGPLDTVDLLCEHGYAVELPPGVPANRRELEKRFSAGAYTVPALARRQTPAAA